MPRLPRPTLPQPAKLGDVIVLQPRDPARLHTYWELTEPTLANGRKRLGAEGETATLTLRVYELKGSGRPGTLGWFDILLTEESADRQIEVTPPDRSWRVEVGLKSAQGTFLALARSNIACTPPDRPSDQVDERWGLIEELSSGETLYASSPLKR